MSGTVQALSIAPIADVNDAQYTDIMHLSHVSITYQATLLGIVLWDWFTSLPAEIRYIWRAPMKLPKILYLISRYVCLSFTVAVFALHFVNKPLEVCNAMVRINCAALTVIQVTSISVLAQRAYAISEKSRWILFVLLSAIATTFALGVSHAAVAVKAAEAVKQEGGLGICHVETVAHYTALSAAFFIVPIAAHTFATAVIVYHAYQNLPASVALRNLIVIDGILFMVAVDSVGLLQLIFFLKAKTGSLGMLNSAALLALTSVFCCKLIIHIRRKGRTLGSVKNTDSIFEGADWTNYFGAPSTADLGVKSRHSISTSFGRKYGTGQTIVGEEPMRNVRTPVHEMSSLHFITVHEDVREVVEDMTESEKEWNRRKEEHDVPTFTVSQC